MSTTFLILSLFGAEPTPLDLQPVAVLSIKEGFEKDNNFVGFDMIEMSQAGTPFKFGKKFVSFLFEVELAGVPSTPDENNPAAKSTPDKPNVTPEDARKLTGKAIKGIKVGRTFDKLSVIHSTRFRAPNDEGIIGWYVLNFKAGEKHRIPIVYGRDVVDWWAFGDTFDKSPADGEVFWEGANEMMKRAVADRGKIRLFRSQFDNPKPEVEVETIDFECASGQCKPFVFAMTVH